MNMFNSIMSEEISFLFSPFVSFVTKPKLAALYRFPRRYPPPDSGQCSPRGRGIPKQKCPRREQPVSLAADAPVLAAPGEQAGSAVDGVS